MLPKDPIMLLSAVNMKLRDHHLSLDDLCKSHNVARHELEESLSKVDYFYDPELNQFK